MVPHLNLGNGKRGQNVPCLSWGGKPCYRAPSSKGLRDWDVFGRCPFRRREMTGHGQTGDGSKSKVGGFKNVLGGFSWYVFPFTEFSLSLPIPWPMVGPGSLQRCNFDSSATRHGVINLEECWEKIWGSLCTENAE